MNFERLVDAIRAEDGEDPELAAVTRLRVRRSLDADVRSRHRVVGLVTAAGIWFGGTASWALVGGDVASLWAPAPRPPARVEVPMATPPGTAAPTAPPEPVAPPVRSPSEPPRRVRQPAAPEPVEALYRRAHDLHFHGGDPARSLAAWDAYLAAEPGGRFSVEARYNRALVLIRLARYRDAREALQPFARGEVGAAYRQPEAQALVERLAQYE